MICNVVIDGSIAASETAVISSIAFQFLKDEPPAGIIVLSEHIAKYSNAWWRKAAYGYALTATVRAWEVSMSDVTRILNAIEQGDARAADELLPLVYEELRLLAAQNLRRLHCSYGFLTANVS